jgi:protein-disulfide isomerase
MYRTPLLSIAAALLFAPAGPAQKAASPAPSAAPKSAFDKPTMEAYARHLWVLGPEFTVTVGDPVPSEQLPGFKEVTIRIAQGAGTQDVGLLVSNDGSRIVQGSIYNINFNPFKADLDKLKTQFQPSQGTPGAPVVLVEFSDMQCPHCKIQAELLKQNLLKTYPTQVRFYYMDYPLVQLHPWAKAASMAGRCVFHGNPQSFWDYHDWVFAHQETLTPETLKSQVMEWAKSQKELDALQLSRCIDDKATEKEIDANIAEAKDLAIDGTPALFINGRRIPNGIDWPSIKRVIDFELEYQKTAKNAGEDCGCETKLDTALPISTAPAGPKGAPPAGKK